ncbi:MAG: DUF1549 and DUF1553 domain-containing protein, partial [Bythopirellula sp.]
PDIPAVGDEPWPQAELDHFILHRLEQAGLRPATDTDRHALIRRAYFDLIGLPPTPEQVQKFVGDDSAGAFERVIDELLASPHFGERWGRHWLDLVRYAETRGHEYDHAAPNVYQYRDYIIRALNADVPYDQLVREHIAGDLIASPRLHPTQGFNESILGTGFWFLGEWVHSPVDVRKDEADRFDNMIDVMSKTFLGLTVSCARCHDHKFDAISSADYYSLSGFLQSSDYRQVRFETLEHNRQIAEQVAEVDQTFQQRVAQFLDDAELRLDFSADPSLDQAAESREHVLVNYAQLSPEDFLQNGYLFGQRPRLAGEAYLDEVDGSPAIRFASKSVAASDPLWSDLKLAKGSEQASGNLQPIRRAGRTLRTPTFQLQHGTVHCRVRGTGHVFACVGSHRLVAGPLHNETIQEIKSDSAWTQLNLNRYVGKRLQLEFTPAPGESLQISLVLQGATKDLFEKIEKMEAMAEHQAEQFAQELEHYLFKAENANNELAALAQEWSERRREIQQQIQTESQLAMAMLDGTGEDDHILIRGNAANPGDVAPRKFLTAIAGDQPLSIASGSGRLELAEQINHRQNPLTARVIVNRIWHHLMGRGIVATTDDFGVMGQDPTHPQLLDYLATRFVADGQSIKQMIRRIMLSRTYRMSSQASAAALLSDPTNRLWQHRPPQRLEGEIIRDALLAVSGQLDPQLFGWPVPVHLTKFMDGRGKPGKSGPLNGNNRRSIYLEVRRNFLLPFMQVFDAPTPFSSMGRRNVSNVPAQALILMNDPLVAELTTKWAERIVNEASATERTMPDAQIRWIYLTAFAREPSDSELLAANRFLSDQAEQRGVELQNQELWADLVHVLVNTKEFIFLR